MPSPATKAQETRPGKTEQRGQNPPHRSGQAVPVRALPDAPLRGTRRRTEKTAMEKDKPASGEEPPDALLRRDPPATERESARQSGQAARFGSNRLPEYAWSEWK